MEKNNNRNQLILPGDILAMEEEYISGFGTFVNNDSISSTIVGHKKIIKDSITISKTISSNHYIRKGKKGDKIICQISDITPRGIQLTPLAIARKNKNNHIKNYSIGVERNNKINLKDYLFKGGSLGDLYVLSVMVNESVSSLSYLINCQKIRKNKGDGLYTSWCNICKKILLQKYKGCLICESCLSEKRDWETSDLYQYNEK